LRVKLRRITIVIHVPADTHRVLDNMVLAAVKAELYDVLRQTQPDVEMGTEEVESDDPQVL